MVDLDGLRVAGKGVVMWVCRRVWLAMAVVLVGSLAWTGAAGADVGRANLDGSGVRPSFIRGSDVGPTSGGYFYWADTEAHTIGRVKLDGSNREPRYIDAARILRMHGDGVHDWSGPWWLSIYGGRIYFETLESPGLYPTVEMWGVNLDGSGAVRWPGLRRWDAASGGYIYWVEENRIVRARLDGTHVEWAFIDTGAGRIIDDVVVDGRHIYWTNRCQDYEDLKYARCDNGRVGRANLDGTGVQRDFVTGLYSPVSLAVGGGRIYWSDECNTPFRFTGQYAIGCPTDRIGRANLDGSRVQRRFITLPGQALALSSLAVAGSHLFFTNSRSWSAPWLKTLGVTPRTFTLTGRIVHGRCSQTTPANRTRPRCTRPVKLKINYTVTAAHGQPPSPRSGHFLYVVIYRLVPGRRAPEGYCAAASPSNRGYPGCTHIVKVPTAAEFIVEHVRTGKNTYTFEGALGPGFYLLRTVDQTTITTFHIRH